MNELRLIDTFSGIGGFSYAAEKLVGGFKTVAFVECEPYCQKVLKKHWPDVPIYDDIKTYNPEPYSADVICGGFPCQDISVAGLQAGITKETRSGLFFELMRIICLVRPQYVVLENVAAILNNGLDIVLRELSQAGYDAEWAIISASSVGACHQRSRWWFIAYPSSISGKQESKICTGRNTITRNSVAYPNDNGSSSSEEFRFNGQTNNSTQERQNETCKLEGSSQPRNSKTIQQATESSNSFSTRTQIQHEQRRSSIWNLPSSSSKKGSTLNPNWQSYESEPCLCRGDDGLSNWTHRLKCLGNSVVPQVAAIPLQRVLDLEKLTVSN